MAFNSGLRSRSHCADVTTRPPSSITSGSGSPRWGGSAVTSGQDRRAEIAQPARTMRADAAKTCLSHLFECFMRTDWPKQGTAVQRPNKRASPYAKIVHMHDF